MTINKLAIVFLFISAGQTFGEDKTSGKDVLDILMSPDSVLVVTSDGKDVVAGNPINRTEIVGADPATIEEYPYQVAFIANHKFFCSGFIISEDYILTAGHCGIGVDPSTVNLQAGATYWILGTTIPIAEIYVHPGYNNPKFDKDVAVFKTAEKIKFTDLIQPIALPEKGRPMKEGTTLHLSGWGKVNYRAPWVEERLWKVDVPVIKHLVCNRVYPGLLTEHEFCGGNLFLGGQGICEGDSGGAAIQDGMAVGIVSFSRGCGQAMSPSVFVDIATETIRDFIKNKTGL